MRQRDSDPSREPGTEPDGSSFERAIPVAGIAEEYAWVGANFPEFILVQQALTEFEGKPFDVLTLRSRKGDERDVYFDISAFYARNTPGKDGNPARSTCPYCGSPLRTDRAEQCFRCGMDWHDPSNVVRRGSA